MEHIDIMSPQLIKANILTSLEKKNGINRELLDAFFKDNKEQWTLDEQLIALKFFQFFSPAFPSFESIKHYQHMIVEEFAKCYGYDWNQEIQDINLFYIYITASEKIEKSEDVVYAEQIVNKLYIQETLDDVTFYSLYTIAQALLTYKMRHYKENKVYINKLVNLINSVLTRVEPMLGFWERN